MPVVKKTLASSKVKKSITQELKELGYRLPHGYSVIKRTPKKKTVAKKKTVKPKKKTAKRK